MEMFEIKREIKSMTDKVAAFRTALAVAEKEKTIKNYEETMQAPGFWDDQRGAQETINAMNKYFELIIKRFLDTHM